MKKIAVVIFFLIFLTGCSLKYDYKIDKDGGIIEEVKLVVSREKIKKEYVSKMSTNGFSEWNNCSMSFYECREKLYMGSEQYYIKKYIEEKIEEYYPSISSLASLAVVDITDSDVIISLTRKIDNYKSFKSSIICEVGNCSKKGWNTINISFSDSNLFSKLDSYSITFDTSFLVLENDSDRKENRVFKSDKYYWSGSDSNFSGVNISIFCYDIVKFIVLMAIFVIGILFIIKQIPMLIFKFKKKNKI